MRVYLPATTVQLADLGTAGELGPAPLTGYAVTPAIREWYLDDDPEELEYAASGQAVRASLRMVDADPRAARRRVVVAADVDEDVIEIRDDLDRGAVRISQPVSVRAVAALHIDDEDAEDVIARAAAVVLEADLGSASAQESVDDAEGFELSWYAPDELPALLAQF
ncbi:MAG: hypothetical protein ABJA87_11125 [bacterium]